MTASATKTELAPTQLFKCLSDITRLQLLLLVHDETEVCVCEFTEALNESQPKISRHLASLRAAGVLRDRRQGQWVFYRFCEDLPAWAIEIITVTARHQPDLMQAPRYRLAVMKDRPDRCC